MMEDFTAKERRDEEQLERRSLLRGVTMKTCCSTKPSQTVQLLKRVCLSPLKDVWSLQSLFVPSSLRGKVFRHLPGGGSIRTTLPDDPSISTH
jgi:hypothetical protein